MLVVGALILASCGETPAAETTTSSSNPTTVVSKVVIIVSSCLAISVFAEFGSAAPIWK